MLSIIAIVLIMLISPAHADEQNATVQTDTAPIQKLIEDGGFQFDRLETGYMRGPKPLTFMYEGSARLR